MNKIIKISISVLLITITAFLVYKVIDVMRIKNPLDKDNEELPSDIINLNGYMSDFIITNGGEYNLTGTLDNHSIIIKASGEEVTLNLRNVTINSNNNSAIVGEGQSQLTINLVTGTENTLSDTGAGANPSTITSNSDLIIIGEGTLNMITEQVGGNGINVKGNNLTIESGIINIKALKDGISSEKDVIINGGKLYILSDGNGIVATNKVIMNNGLVYILSSEDVGSKSITATNGYVINGGTLLAFGSDELENPLDISTQNVLCLNMNYKLERKTLIAFSNTNGDLIIGTMPERRFKNIILSTEALVEGDYKVYTNGTMSASLVDRIYSNGSYKPGVEVKIDNNSVFSVTSVVNSY